VLVITVPNVSLTIQFIKGCSFIEDVNEFCQEDDLTGFDLVSPSLSMLDQSFVLWEDRAVQDLLYLDFPKAVFIIIFIIGYRIYSYYCLKYFLSFFVYGDYILLIHSIEKVELYLIRIY